jgi:polar amino acid transport system permease protein
VLFLNTAAYSAEIFYGALQIHPQGRSGGRRRLWHDRLETLRRIVWPTMLRLAWPAYTNEAIFLFHATTLVFFSGFPAFAQTGRRAVLRELLCRQDLQPLRRLPDRRLYFILTLDLVTAGQSQAVRHLPSKPRKIRLLNPVVSLLIKFPGGCKANKIQGHGNRASGQRRPDR